MIRLSKHRSHTTSLDFFPDGSHLVSTAMSGKVIWLWDLRNGGQPKKITPPKVPARVKPLHVQTIFVGAQNQVIFNHVYFEDGQYHSPVRMYEPSSGEIAEVSNSFFTIMTLHKNRTVVKQKEFYGNVHRFWDITSGEGWREENWGTFGSLQAISNNLQLRAFQNSKSENRLQFINWPENQVVTEIAVKHYWGTFRFSDSGKYFLHVFDEEMTVLNSSTGKPVSEVISVKKMSNMAQHGFSTLEFTPDEKYLIAAIKNNILLIDWQKGTLKSSYDFEIGNIVTLKISDDGLTLAASGDKREIVVVDLELD